MKKLQRIAQIAAPIYCRMGWTWGLGAREHSPTLEEIEAAMKFMLARAIKGKHTQIETGRLLLVREDDALPRWRFFLSLGELPIIEEVNA